MKTLEGNLITMAKAGAFDVIVHGANCFHTMGAGIALAISNEFPEALAADKETVYGDIAKGGTYSHATTPSGLVVVNAYTQYMTGPVARLDWISMALTEVAADYHGKRIGMPAIGCGIGGLKMDEVLEAMNRIFPDENTTLVIFKP